MIDQACGTGILTLQMARRFPTCRIVGVDLHREYLSLAARKAEGLNVHNVQWVQGRAEDVVLKGRYDCITSSYLAKYADMDRLVQGAKKMLRDGGVLVMHDFTYPRRRILSDALGLYFRIMKTVGSRAFPQWKIVFNELEDFLKESRWVPALISSLERYGFRGIRAERLALGFAAIVSAVRT
jgi:demethylmenaquinone methyltransferase/2-methoxy-6-polyprenyl-1,4-benzoquinol methylase